MLSKEDCRSLLAFLKGILIPSPPYRAGRATRSRSSSLGGGRPVDGQLGANIRGNSVEICPLAQ